MDATIATEGFRVFIELAVIVLEAAAALVILVAAGWALTQYIRTAFSRRRTAEAVPLAGSPIRVGFGRSLLLALEFTVGSTILKVSITPTLQDVGVVAVVVVVRVVLAFVLQYELSRAHDEGIASKRGTV
ncbi:MAG: DUF1622 domain-containing protein [Methanobacteriota archaeon]